MSVIRTMATSPRGELTLLFVASCAVIFVLVLAIALGGASWMTGAHLRLVLLTCLAAGLAVAGIALLGLPQLVFGSDDARSAEVRRLQQALGAAEAIVHAEPQVVVVWEHGAPVRVAVNSLTGVAGLPADLAQLQRFGSWLDAASAQELKSALDALFADGRSFNLLMQARQPARTSKPTAALPPAGRCCACAMLSAIAGTLPGCSTSIAT